MQETRVVSISIDVPWREVYDFAHRMQNLPHWASGLSSGIREHDGRWFADSPMGEVEVRMSPANDLGVLDHRVVLPSGLEVYNALRAMPNGEGCELAFTIFRQDAQDDAAFAADAAHVERDLLAIKALLEGRPAATIHRPSKTPAGSR